MLDLVNLKYSIADIERKRTEIEKLIIKTSPNIKNGTINSISTADLKLMFELYDEIFFNCWFKKSFKGKMIFSLSRRMTKSAGLTLCPKNIDKIRQEELIIEIRIGVELFFHYDQIDGSKNVCGFRTNNSLEALQLVLEHELCHVIEFIYFNKSNCSGERFKVIANNLFGHTESYHILPTHKQIAKQKLGLNIGDSVTFTFENNKLEGLLYNINKRATIMVRDKKGSYTDKQGNRYSKYYVPLSLLKKQGDKK